MAGWQIIILKAFKINITFTLNMHFTKLFMYMYLCAVLASTYISPIDLIHNSNILYVLEKIKG